MRILPRQRGERIRRRSERPFEAEFTVTRVDDGAGRSGDTSYGILVDLAMSGSADQYSDYNLTDEGGYLAIYGDKTVIEEGETSVVFQLVTVNDHVKEADQTAVITVEQGTSINMLGGLFAADAENAEASVMILDDDHWVVSLAESGQPGDPYTEIKEEGTTSAGIVLTRAHEVMTPTRPGDTTYPIDVTLAYDGQATAADYQMIETVVQSGGGTEEVTRDGGTTTFEIQAGQTQKSIEIKAVDDVYIEILYEILEISLTGAAYDGETYPTSSSDNAVAIDIKTNDNPELFAVTYQNANYITTDPIYDSAEFDGWLRDTTITQDHWFDKSVADAAGIDRGYESDREYPVSYLRSEYYTAKAEWYGILEPGYVMYVQVEGPVWNGVLYSDATAATSGGSQVLTATAVSNNAFSMQTGGAIKYYPEFELNWEYKVVEDSDPVILGGLSYLPAGKSTNEMYVTYQEPIGTKLYHSVVHIGTTDGESAGQNPEEAAVVAAIWADFADRNVECREGLQMRYYNPRDTMVGTTGSGVFGYAGACTRKCIANDKELPIALHRGIRRQVLRSVVRPRTVRFPGRLRGCGFRWLCHKTGGGHRRVLPGYQGGAGNSCQCPAL